MQASMNLMVCQMAEGAKAGHLFATAQFQRGDPRAIRESACRMSPGLCTPEHASTIGR